MSVVLIVEDEVAVRVVAERILKQAGHEVLSAGSVTDALAIIHSMQRFDLLFTDMKLGEEVQGGIRVSEGIAKSRPGLPGSLHERRSHHGGHSVEICEASHLPAEAVLTCPARSSRPRPYACRKLDPERAVVDLVEKIAGVEDR